MAQMRRLVARTALVERLLHAREARVVLLAAGAGSGKTTLLAQWAARDDRPFARVALDRLDDEPAVLAGDINRALDAAGLCAEDAPIPVEAFGAAALSRSWSAVAARACPFVLVLDDRSE